MLQALAAVVVAVAQVGNLAFFQFPRGRQLASWPMPAGVMGLFVAPDGAVWAPLVGGEQTVVVRADTAPVPLEGRVVPLFFREADRFYALLSQEVVALSYPERAEIGRWPVPLGAGVRFATCSRDGRVVALLTGGPGPQLVTVYPFDGGQYTARALPQAWQPFKVVLTSSWVAIAGKAVVAVGTLTAGDFATAHIPGRVVDIAFDQNERALYLLASCPESTLYRLPVPKKTAAGLRAKMLWKQEGEPLAMAVSSAGVFVMEAKALRLVSFRGKEEEVIFLQDATALAVLPEKPFVSTPPWSDVKR